MEILALYTSPDALETALAAGARHLAATLNGFALVYRTGEESADPDGWAGFTCAKDAQAAGNQLGPFREEIVHAKRPLRTAAPESPARVWKRGAGGLYGFPLEQAGKLRGVAIIGCPTTWPRIRNAEIESILKQLALVLDHHAVSASQTGEETSEEDLLKLSEKLFEKDVEEIEQRQEIERLQRNQVDLIDKITHEVQEPLNTVIERIISVLASDHRDLSEAGRSSLRTALDEGNHLIRLLQNFSDLWKLQQGRMRVELRDVSLPEVIDEAIFNVRDSFEPEVILEKRLGTSLPKVRTDLGKLNQILFHLLDNAAKYTRRGRIEIEIRVEDGSLCCSVSDTGIGITPDDQHRVFEEFFQVDDSLDSPQRGTGLGLTLTRSLVEQLGGSITLSSSLGQGSRLAFSLPVTVL